MFEFIEAEKATYPITTLCASLGVTRQGFYAWRKRPPCQRRIVDAAYTAVIKKIHTESRRTYGADALSVRRRVEAGGAVPSLRSGRH